tara:strand:+ start:600 stop:1013 length:414 start_codon:yes stop_codon:yes gene_type:complete
MDIARIAGTILLILALAFAMSKTFLFFVDFDEEDEKKNMGKASFALLISILSATFGVSALFNAEKDFLDRLPLALSCTALAFAAVPFFVMAFNKLPKQVKKRKAKRAKKWWEEEPEDGDEAKPSEADNNNPKDKKSA